MKKLSVFLVVIMLMTYALSPTEHELTIEDLSHETVQFMAKDGMLVTADLYPHKRANAPWILLFHRTGWSRGEYLEIAPKLNSMGFSCMAVDLRAGLKVNDVKNATYQYAVDHHMSNNKVEAYRDVDAAIRYATYQLSAEKVILWGSSFSTSLSIAAAVRQDEYVDGVVLFSPSDYLEVKDKEMTAYIEDIDVPVFMASQRREKRYWVDMYEALESDKYAFIPSGVGNHGSEALWSVNLDSDGYWQALNEFLNDYFIK